MSKSSDRLAHDAQIMIGSTARDLPAHRKAAIDAVWRCNLSPLVIESGLTSSANVVRHSLELTDQAAAYVGIYAQRYGFVPRANNPENISVAEMEYRRAVERGIPVLVFIMSDDHPLLGRVGDLEQFIESNPRSKKKLKKLKDDLIAAHEVVFFRSVEDLGMQIMRRLLELAAPPPPDAPGSFAPVEHAPYAVLSAPEALARLTELGIRGETPSLMALVEALDSHPLLLALIAGQVRATARGDVEAWQRASANRHFMAQLAAMPSAQRVPFTIKTTLEDLPAEQRALLNMLCALRHPVSYAALVRQNPYATPKPPKVSEPRRWRTDYAEAKAAWDAYQQALQEHEVSLITAQPRLHAALSDLEARGLIAWERATNRCDVHPVVADCVAATWDAATRAAVYERVRQHHESFPPDPAHASEIYTALLKSGQIDAAIAFYRVNLSKASTDPQATVQMLTPFFKGGLSALPALNTARDRAYFGSEMAHALGDLGRTSEALTLLGLTFQPFIEANEALHLAAALLNYAGLLHEDKQFAAKIRAFELARDLGEAAGDAETLAAAHLFLLRSYVDTGQWEAAEQAYRAFCAGPQRARTPLRQANAERIYARMLVYQGKDPTNALNLAWELAKQSRSVHEERSIHALWGETALQQKRPDAAERFFQAALELTENGSVASAYRGGLARAYAYQGKLAEARAVVEQGIPAVAAAEVYMVLGEIEQAQAAALKAYRAAWLDGPPYSLWWELQRAHAVLDALDVPLPELPPFGDAERALLPCEPEIRAFIAQQAQQYENSEQEADS